MSTKELLAKNRVVAKKRVSKILLPNSVLSSYDTGRNSNFKKIIHTYVRTTYQTSCFGIKYAFVK